MQSAVKFIEGIIMIIIILENNPTNIMTYANSVTVTDQIYKVTSYRRLTDPNCLCVVYFS